MTILDLQKAIVLASQEYAVGNNLEFYYINNVNFVQTNFELPNNTLLVDTLGRAIVTSKELTNETDKPITQRVHFDEQTENKLNVQTTYGYKFGAQTDKNAKIDVYFTLYDDRITTTFKYNPSIETTYTSKETLNWSQNIPIVVPPRTKTKIDYIITIGNFNTPISYFISVYGIVVFKYRSGPSDITYVPLTYRGETGESIGDIMGRIYNINARTNPIYGYWLDVEGTLNLEGCLGIQSETRIKNTPLQGNPLPESIQSILGETKKQAIFF
ncbi:ETX/MTX2 family pore-forming toxin [Virgibacillus dokdonensis]|uniref:ETX/MTX2 family pore-forming toxin n=1 Tax=Virgibacillus dokdonensis TaxID=302167 RepID=UPI0015F2549C|nr:ETX/MTX2 family pore-forming toxin [Virgibacillus dokdonensis]